MAIKYVSGFLKELLMRRLPSTDRHVLSFLKTFGFDVTLSVLQAKLNDTTAGM